MVCLSQRRESKDVPMVKVVVDSIGTQLQMRTFDMGVSLYVGGVYVQHLEYKGERLFCLYSGTLNSLQSATAFQFQRKAICTLRKENERQLLTPDSPELKRQV